MINKLAFIGAGSMAEAILSGILKQELVRSEQIFVTNHSNQVRLDLLKEHYHVQASHDKREVLQDADVVVLSMKPYDMSAAIDSIKSYLKPNQIVISVAAGVSTDYISLLVKGDNPIIRAMPNTSASIGLSATALAKGNTATEKHLTVAEQLFKTIGMTVNVEEQKMDAVTAISGSGPAYIYYLVEAMEKVAIDLGLDADIAKSLIIQTIIGAGEMLKSSEETPEKLRENITSPNGTTEAAIHTLKKYDFQKAIIECVKSASERSKELGKHM